MGVLKNKVIEMRVQRKKLFEDLRRDIHADDITSKLIFCRADSMEVVYLKELSKFDDPIRVLDLNLKGEYVLVL